MPESPVSSVPQFLVLKVPVSSVAVTTALDISAVSAAMSPAPIWHPVRAGLILKPVSDSISFSVEPEVRSPASSAAILAAMTASSVSLAMTLVALR